MNIDKIISRSFVFLFLVSIPSTYIFWSFLSDRSGVDEETEKAFASVLNSKFEQGDIVFPEVDWDLGFLKYIDPGIHPVYLTLKETAEKDIRLMKEEGGKIFFLLKSEESWKEISGRTGVNELEIIKAGSGVVVIGSDGTESQRKPLVFSRDIGNAENVWFSKGEERFPCVKSSLTRWQCSKDDWNYVGLTTAAMNGKQQKAVWAHPKTGMTLHIEFDVPDKGRKIIFNTAFLETGYRSENKSPVEVELLIDGISASNYSNKSERKVYSNTIVIPADSKVLELRFKTEDAGQRHFVFNGYIEE
jgi:hypothetical protein